MTSCIIDNYYQMDGRKQTASVVVTGGNHMEQNIQCNLSLTQVQKLHTTEAFI